MSPTLDMGALVWNRVSRHVRFAALDVSNRMVTVPSDWTQKNRICTS